MVIAIAAFLAGCRPALYLEVRNELDETVYAQDFKRGTVAILPKDSAVLDLPGRRLTVQSGQKYSFDLRLPPSKHVHTRHQRLVVYGILGNDRFLYIATKSAEGKLQRLEPQPDGFPLKGERIDLDSLQ